MKQTLIAIVENKPGVLNRVASLFRRRGFNIDSLNVGRTEDPEISRMTIALDSEHVTAERVESNLYKLVNVVDVQDVTNQNAILRELALVKIQTSNEDRVVITTMIQSLGASVADISDGSMVVQMVAFSAEVDSLLDLLRPYGILESVRTGHIAMMRGTEAGTRHTPGRQ